MQQKQPMRFRFLLKPPIETDLQEQLATAKQNPDTVVEMYWPDSSDSKKSNILSCLIGSGRGLLARQTLSMKPAQASEPQWRLVLESLSGKTTIWHQLTSDTGLLINLLGEPAPAADGVGAQKSSTEFNLTKITGEFEAGRMMQPNSSERDSSVAINFQGDLKNVSLASILQSISLCTITGRLDIFNNSHKAEVFFKNGLITHATKSNSSDLQLASQQVGEQVVVELFTWKEGAYYFHHDRSAEQTSIHRRLESLLMQGVGLADHYDALCGLGFDLNATCCQIQQNLDRDELMTIILKSGLDSHLAEQESVYRAFAKPSPIKEVIDTLGLSVSVYVPVMFSLMNAGVIGAPKTALLGGSELVPFEIDEEANHWAYRSLLNPNTEMLVFPLFAFFLKQEFERCERNKQSFCLAIGTSLNQDKQDKQDRDVLRSVAQVIAPLRKDLDMMTKISDNTLAVVFPALSDADAYSYLQQWSLKLTEKSLPVVFGLATAPQNGSTSGMLLAAAKNACERALALGRAISIFNNPQMEEWSDIFAAAYQAYQSGEYVLAEEKLRDALALAEKTFPSSDKRVLQTLNLLARVYAQQHRHELAEPILKAVAASTAKSTGPDYASCAQTFHNLARCLYQQAKYDEAWEALQDLILLGERDLGSQHSEMAYMLNNLAAVYIAEGNSADAETTYMKALNIAKASLGPTHATTVKLQAHLSKLVGKRLAQIQGRIAPEDKEEDLWLSLPEVKEAALVP